MSRTYDVTLRVRRVADDWRPVEEERVVRVQAGTRAMAIRRAQARVREDVSRLLATFLGGVVFIPPAGKCPGIVRRR